MEKTDLREQSDSELSLMVFNDESLYRMRNNSDFVEYLEEIFKFNSEQLKELAEDLESDLIEA